MAVRVSLRVVLLSLFIVSSLTIAIIAFVPTLMVGERGVQDTANQLRTALQAHVGSIMSRYVTGIQLANDQYYEPFQLGILDPFADEMVTVKSLCATLKATPDLVFTQIGTAEVGAFFGCEKSVLPGGGASYVGWWRNSSDWSACHLYSLDNVTFDQIALVNSLVGYDPRQRGWYQVNLGQQAWTTPYLWASGVIVGVTAGRPIFYPNGTTYGVYAVDIIIDSVTEFLRRIDFGPNGAAFIIDRNTEELVGLSWLGEDIMQNITGGNVNGWIIELKKAQNIGHPRMRRVTEKLGGTSASILQYGLGLHDFKDDWVSLTDIDDPHGLRWRLVVALDRQDYLGDFYRDRTTIIIAVCCVLVVMMFAQIVLSQTLLRSLTDLTARMQEMNAKTLTENATREDEDPSNNTGDVQFSSLGEVAIMQQSFSQMSTTIQSFSRYVPKEVVCDLLYKGELARVGVAPMHCTVVFTDIEKFTTITQRVIPEQLAVMMESYYDSQTKVINDHGGVIDKFIGDAIMVCWGAPIEIDSQNVRAVATGLSMLASVQSDALKEAFAPCGVPLNIRVGVSSGVVLAGNMGGQTRLNYTLIGDAVNLSSRLESLNKQFGTRLLVSEDMLEDIEHIVCTRFLGHIQVAGFERATNVYEVCGLVPEFANRGQASKVIKTIRIDGTASQRSNMMSQSHRSTRYSQPAAISAEVQAMRAKRLAAVLDVEEILSAARVACHICNQDEAEFCRQYSEATKKYLNGDFKGAMEKIKIANRHVPAWASKSADMLAQCERLASGSTTADWTGTIELSNK